MSNQVFITETGLRDGLQALPEIIPTEFKINCIRELIQAGLTNLEVASFVHPKKVPTMADAEELCQQLEKKEGFTYMGLVLNERGIDRALNTQLDAIQAIVYGTETFAQKNAGYGLEESKQIFQKIMQKARTRDMKVIGGVSVAFGCRYEGKVSEEKILDLVKFLLDQGVSTVSLADSTGMGNPNQVKQLCYAAQDLSQNIPITLHLHNTENKGYANLYAALETGIRHFDTAFGGLGGCPFIPKAKGNIATEDTVHLLNQMGYETNIDIHQVAKVSEKMAGLLKRELPSLMYKLINTPSIKII